MTPPPNVPRIAVAIAAVLTVSLGLVPVSATAKTADLVEISNLEDRRSLGDGKLAKLLRDDDPRTRASAARAFGRIGSESGIAPLLQALEDSDGGVRLEALFALGQIGSEQARDALIRTAGSNVPVEERAEAVRALGKLGGDGAAEAVLPFLADGVPEIRGEAAIALAASGDSLAAGDLRPLLGDENPMVRARAAWAAGRLKAGTVAPELRALLADEDPQVKLAATKAIGQVGDTEPIRELSLLVRDPDWRVRVNVASSLGATKSIEALAGLAILAEDENPLVRAAVGAGLKDIPYHYKKDDILFPLVKDPAPVVRGSTMETFAVGLETQHSSIAEHWTSCGDSSTYVVIKAYESFAGASRRRPKGSAGTQWRTAAWFYMKGRMQNQSAPLSEKIVAAYNLGAFENAGPRNTLIDALTVHHPLMTAAALHGLGELIPFDSTLAPRHILETPPLIRRVLEEDPAAKTEIDIRLAAAEALGAFDTQDSKNLLRELLGDPEWRVRDKAAASLEKLGEPRPEVKPDGPLPGPAEPLDEAYVKSKSGRWSATVSTSRGDFVIELLNREAPRTVQNFVQLAEDGYFARQLVHRVVPNFVMQTGCPIGNGWGGPGYEIRCEYNRRSYTRGTVGMAHAGKDSGGSQFFVTHSAQPHLDGRYTVFGRVTEGMDVVDAILPEDEIVSVTVKKKLW